MEIPQTRVHCKWPLHFITPIYLSETIVSNDWKNSQYIWLLTSTRTMSSGEITLSIIRNSRVQRRIENPEGDSDIRQSEEDEWEWLLTSSSGSPALSFGYLVVFKLNSSSKSFITYHLNCWDSHKQVLYFHF